MYNLKIKEFEGNTQKELKIELHDEITTYLYRSLPVSIILSDSRFFPWYHQHYIQICSQMHQNGYITLDYMEPEINYGDILEHSFIGYDTMDSVGNIINFVLNQIECGYYVIICLDEFYLSEKKFYNKQHFVHESLIYGYDNVGKKFMGIGFNRSHTFSKITFDYDMFNHAYESGRTCYMDTAPYAKDHALQLLSIKPARTQYPFNLDTFLSELKSLINSTGEIKKVNYIVPPGGQWQSDNTLLLKNRICYGIETYDVVISGLDCVLGGKQVMDYRAFHLLSEHSRGISKRIEYIRSNYNMDGRIAENCKGYDQERKRLDSLRLDALKIPYLQQAKLEFTIIEMKSTLYSIKENTKAILSKVYERLLAGSVNLA